MKLGSNFSILASFAVLCYASSPDDVLNNIAVISQSVSTLDAAISVLSSSGGTLANALAIHNGATSLGSTIDKGTTDVVNVTPSPVSEANSRAILSAVAILVPKIENAVANLVVKKAAFAALPIGGAIALVKQDLINLNASTFNFEAALIADAPADLKDNATTQKVAVDSAFGAAIAAYT